MDRMSQMNYLIKNVTIISPDSHGSNQRNIVIDQGIIKVIATDAIPIDFNGVVINGDHLIAVPSFANAHLHLGETIFRGLCDGKDLTGYLEISHSFFEKKKRKLSEETLHSLTGYITLFEAIRAGTGCVGCSRGHKEMASLGMRALCGIPFIRIEKLSAYANNYLEIFTNHLRDYEPLIKTGVFIQGLKTINPEDLFLVKSLQDKYEDIRVMIHLAETVDDVEYCKNKYGVRPVEYLNQIGLLNDRCICVHLVHIENSEMELIYESKANVVLCPSANLKLSSGRPPIEKFYQNKIPFSLATDGLAVSGSASLLEQAKLASLITGGRIPAHDLLRSITEIPYEALGFKDGGKIVENKSANLALFSYSPTALFPNKNLVSQLVHNYSIFQCQYLWVEGRLVLSNNTIVGHNEEKITRSCLELLKQLL